MKVKKQLEEVKNQICGCLKVGEDEDGLAGFFWDWRIHTTSSSSRIDKSDR